MVADDKFGTVCDEHSESEMTLKYGYERRKGETDIPLTCCT